MSYKLGILDQSPLFSNETATEAFNNTIDLAKDAEKWGYARFWVSEHHNMEGVAGTSPEILISHLLAHTEKINIGSGGVMLQHYSAYKVVENFHVLASLAPGRVDLGVGKAPGGLDLSTKALQYGSTGEQVDFNDKLTLVKQFIDNNLTEEHPLQGVKAMPQPTIKPSVFLLGGSENSAQLAADLTIEFVFARFLNSNDKDLKEAVEAFRSKNKLGKFIAAVSVLAAETTEEAVKLAEGLKLYEIKFKDNRTLTVQSYDQVEAQKEQTTEPFDVKERKVDIITGTPAEVKVALDNLHEKYGIDEFILHTPLNKIAERRKSFELLRPKGLELQGHRKAQM